MFFALMASIAAFFFTAVTQAAYLNMDNAARIQREIAHDAVGEVASAVRRYKEIYGTYPASLAALAGAGGFEHLKPLLASVGTNALGYVVTSAPVSDGVWRFDRAVIFTVKVQAGETAAAYTAVNYCGTGDIASATSWCGSPDSYWARNEGRDRYVPDLIAERLRQHRLIKKFTEAYNSGSDGNFPDVGSEYAQLTSLVGFGGNARSCTGTYQWKGIPLDCDDLYSVFGTPTVINQITRKHIALLSESAVKDASGSLINVATDMHLE